MASNLKYSVAARNAQQDALSAQIGASAKIRVYSGSQPADVGTAISGQTLLVEFIGNAGGFAPAASGGVLTASTIAAINAVAAGTAAFFRIFKSDGTTAVIDGSVGTAAADLILDNTNIANGQNCSITSLTITRGNA